MKEVQPVTPESYQKSSRLPGPLKAALAVLALSALAFAPVPTVRAQQAPAIFTVAGGNYGDGKPALDARLQQPVGISEDSSGNLYFSEYLSGRVRRVSVDGTINTVAGYRFFHDSGDGGPATDANFIFLNGTTLGPDGLVYIVDSKAGRIRRINADGTIQTVAGGAAFTPNLGDGGQALDAFLNFPQNVAFDAAGNLYVTDSRQQRIRKISPSGIITTIAGASTPSNSPNGAQGGFTGDKGPATQALLRNPTDLAFDKTGKLYFTDTDNHRIRKIDLQGNIDTVIGAGRGFDGDGGPAIAARLNFPTRLAIDADGQIYVTDSNNLRVRKVDTQGIITTVAGSGAREIQQDNGIATEMSLHWPRDVFVENDGSVLIADDNLIYKLHQDGTMSRFIGGGLGDGGAAAQTLATQTVVVQHISPDFGVAVDRDGNILFTDSSGRVRSLSPDGIISTVAGKGSPLTFLDSVPSSKQPVEGNGGLAKDAIILPPQKVITDPEGDIYILDWSNDMLGVNDQRNIRVVYNALASPPATYTPEAISVGKALNGSVEDAAGNVYSVTPSNNYIFKTGPGGGTTTVAGNGDVSTVDPPDGAKATEVALGFDTPISLAVDSEGMLFYSQGGTVKRIGTDDILTTVAGKPPDFLQRVQTNGESAASSSFDAGSIAIDSTGAILITDRLHNSIRKIPRAAAPGLMFGGKPFPKTVQTFTPGDGNGDGEVNVKDATLSLRLITGLVESTLSNRTREDIVPDGALTIEDTIRILRFSVGL